MTEGYMRTIEASAPERRGRDHPLTLSQRSALLLQIRPTRPLSGLMTRSAPCVTLRNAFQYG